jgi:hypothetical protein
MIEPKRPSPDLPGTPNMTEELTDEELLAELNRRQQEVDEGKVEPVPLADFRFDD